MAVEFLFEQLNPELAGFCPKRLQRITPWLQKYVDEGKLPFANVEFIIMLLSNITLINPVNDKFAFGK